MLSPGQKLHSEKPQNSTNQFLQLTREQPCDITGVTSEIEFPICSALFLTVPLSWQEALFTYCMLSYCKPVFHFQAHVLVSCLVSFMVGRYCKSEPALNLELIQSLRGERAVSCWGGVQTVLSMTHGLAWCLPADKHNGLCTQ